jgi:hypothetical protein
MQSCDLSGTYRMDLGDYESERRGERQSETRCVRELHLQRSLISYIENHFIEVDEGARSAVCQQ